MIRYILVKIKNKYKLYLCLIVGIVSMITMFSLVMMFRRGSLDKSVMSGFLRQYESSGAFPAVLQREDALHYEDVKENMGDSKPSDFMHDYVDDIVNDWDRKLQIPVVSDQRTIFVKNVQVLYSYGDSGHADVGYYDTDEEHFTVISGVEMGEDISSYSDSGVEIPEGAVPCYVSESMATTYGVVPGEVITLSKVSATEDAVVYVSGIVRENRDDYYWNEGLPERAFLIVDKDFFDYLVQTGEKNVYYRVNHAVDYRYIDSTNVMYIQAAIKSILKKDLYISESITPVVKNYNKESVSIKQMTYVITLPLIILVIVFIGMISFRIIDSENGELRNLRDRGLSKSRIIGMYLIQSVILCAVSLAPGVLLGFLLGKLVAGTDDFMSFTWGADRISTKDYIFTPSMILAGLVACIVAIIIMIIPVLLFFKKKKEGKKRSVVPTWERYYLDIILIAISIYLLVNYNKQLDNLAQDVINGKGIDPVIFINSTLFLFACGMLIMRLIFYVVKFVTKLGSKKYKIATYAGLLQILRTRKSSGVISIFLVMTVAMSLFNANMARTINANKQARIEYNVGTEMRIKEKWKLKTRGIDFKTWDYREPAYQAYEHLNDDGTFDAITKVMYSEKGIAVAKQKNVPNVTIMGVNTKEFGEIAQLDPNLNDKHWYNYLNTLAKNKEGILISRNLANTFEIKEGDMIRVFIKSPIPEMYGSDDAGGSDLKVVGIIDAWPGYDKYKYAYSDETEEVVVSGENHPGLDNILSDPVVKTVKKSSTNRSLIIMNYSNSMSVFGTMPYEVWVRTDASTDEVRDKLKVEFEGTDRYLNDVVSTDEEILEEKSTAILQITNGLFTADFIIALILCIIGYMIYWLTSIRDRELLFGIYRAMGISRKEINSMIMIEQAFLSLVAIMAGIIAGVLSSKLFAKLFATFYLPQKHNIALFASSSLGDMLKLGLILLLFMVICIIWNRRIIKDLNITEALKLGDD